MRKIKKILSVFLAVLMLFTTFSLVMPVFAQYKAEIEADTEMEIVDEEKEAHIISEVIDKRTENTKQFLMSDGSYVLAQYNSSVHYLTNENEWVDIDNTLCESAATTVQAEVFGQSNIIRTKSEETNIVFAEKANSNILVFFDDEKYPISLNYQSMKNSRAEITEKSTEFQDDEAFLNLSHLTDEIIYEDAYKNVDLQYIVSSNGIKENIILKNATAQNSFVVNYNIGELSAKAVSKNEIHLLDGKDVIYVISAPVMYDAEGNTSSEIELNIIKNKNGKLRFEILPDENWLSTAVYPVTIDPSIIDAKEYSISGICVNGTSTSTDNFTITHGSTSYALLDIQKSDNNTFLDHVVSAKLNLPVVSGSVIASSRVYVREIIEDWKNENQIINTDPDSAEIVEDYKNINTSTKTLSFDLTGLFSKWENGGSNKGIRLEMGTSGSVRFETTSSEPILTVQYMNTCGLDSSMPYTEFDMGSAGYVYVNNYSGNLVLTRDDEISTTGEEYPYDFSMTYNSLATIDESNSRWLPSYMSGFSSSSVYTAPDGTQQFFVKGRNAEDEDLYDLKENDYGWECLKATEYWSVTLPIVGVTLRVPVGFDAWKNDYTEKHSFNTKGLQRIVIGENLNTENATVRTIFSREAIADSSDFFIVDGSGHKLLVSETDSTYTLTQYIKNTENTNVTYAEGESVTYTFDDDGNVVQIKRGDAIEAIFTYVDDKIASITDNENHTVAFEYNGKRITKITETRGTETGTTVSFERGLNNVTIRTAGANGTYDDSDDSLVTSRYDSSLKLLGESYSTYSDFISNKSLGAISYDRNQNAQTTSAFDGISRIGVSGKNPVNLLKNHRMESMENWTTARIGDSKSVYTASVANNVSHSGTSSIKLTVSDFTASGGVCVYQMLTPESGLIECGKNYVASVYIKTDGITYDTNAPSTQAYGATMMIRTVANGKTSTAYTESIKKTDSTVDGGWTRVFFNFTVPQNCTKLYIAPIIINGTGTAYFDSIQLEEGETPSRYNLVENNGFERLNSSNSPEAWTRYNLESCDVATDGEFKIVGNPTKNKGLYQDIDIGYGNQSDTYIFSAWSRGEGVPRSSGGEYCLYGFVLYEDANGNRTDAGGNLLSQPLKKAYFDSDYSDDQFLSTTFDLSTTKDPTWTPYCIRVAVTYYKGVNDVHFDNVSLFRTDEVIDLSKIDAEQEEETADPYTYDENERVLTYTDEEGVVYTYSYNAYGDVVSILNSDGEGDIFEYNTYDTDGDGSYDTTRIRKETYQDGTVYEYIYDNDLEITKETVTIPNSEGEPTVEEYNYDGNGNLITHVVDNVVKVRYDYDSENRVSIEEADGFVTVYSYNDSNGELARKAKTQNGVVIEEDLYSYNSAGNYLESHSHTENNATLVTHYNKKGAVTSVEHNGFSYNYEYDNFGNTKNVKVGNQSLVQYNYLPDKSKLDSMTYGNGDTVSYDYDNYGGISKKTVSDKAGDGSTKSYYYTYLTDGEGRTVYEKDSMSGERTTYQYDSEGRLLGERVYNNQGYVYRNQLYGITNTFDESGNITNEALTGNGYTHNMPFTYNEEGRQTSATLTSVRALSYAYNDDGQLETRTLTTDTPIVESYTYNDDGFIEAHRVDDATRDDTYSYTYDENGNITEIKQNGNIIFSYVYDELNQLVRENNSVSGKTVTFSYDNYGNIDSKSEYAFTLGELGAVVDTVNYTYDNVWKDKLTSYDGQDITYDAIGNPTNYMGATMTWNGRQLMSYSKDGTNVSYTYDGDGLRTSKTVNGVKHNYYYVDGVLMYEKNDVYDYYYRYDQDGRLAMIIRRRLSDNYKWYYYIVSNTRGDIMEIHNGQGQITAKYNYDAWGKLVSITNANGTPLADGSFAHLVSVRYRGYYYDTETGLYYLQSRYYDPETGRFINADAVDYIGYSGEQLSYNAFAYCENNAVNCVDYFGFLPTNNFFELYSKIKKILMFIFPTLIRLKSMSEQAINLSSYKSSILSMNRISQTIHYDRKYDLFEIDTIAETNKWYMNESYTIVTYSTTVENWYKIYDSVSKKMRTKSIKNLVNAAMEILAGLIIGKFFPKTAVAKAFSKLSLAAGIIDIPVGVLGLIVSDSAGYLEENLRDKDDSDTYTFNWVVIRNREYLGQQKQKVVLEWYCDLAYIMGAFL